MPSLHRKLGALSLPLADTGESDLASLDPAKSVLLELFAAALNDELGERWQDATGSIDVLAGTNPVQSKFPFEPDPEDLTQVKAGFPALFLDRKEEPQAVTPFTIYESQRTCRWALDYVIGPLAIGQRERVRDIFNAVLAVVDGVLNEGGHAAYATATTAGGETDAAIIFGPEGGTIGVRTLRFAEQEAVRFGRLQFTAGGPGYWACMMTLESVELTSPTEGAYTTLQGASYDVGIAGDEGTLPSAILADTDAIPFE